MKRLVSGIYLVMTALGIAACFSNEVPGSLSEKIAVGLVSAAFFLASLFRGRIALIATALPLILYSAMAAYLQVDLFPDVRFYAEDNGGPPLWEIITSYVSGDLLVLSLAFGLIYNSWKSNLRRPNEFRLDRWDAALETVLGWVGLFLFFTSISNRWYFESDAATILIVYLISAVGVLSLCPRALLSIITLPNIVTGVLGCTSLFILWKVSAFSNLFFCAPGAFLLLFHAEHSTFSENPRIKRILSVLRWAGIWALSRWRLWLALTASVAIPAFAFYVEEDWRGERAWANAQKRWESEGISFDAQQFSPPAIPDDQNLAKIPLFALKPYLQGYSEPIALREALERKIAYYFQDEKPNIDRLRKGIASTYKSEFPRGKLLDSIDQFNAIYPFLVDLRKASVERPLCQFRFEIKPSSNDLNITVPWDTNELCGVLIAHALLVLDRNQPDVALADLKLIFKLASGMKSCLISNTVGLEMSMCSKAFHAIQLGLAHHEWTDDQLKELDAFLSTFDFLQDVQLAVRAEIQLNRPYFDHLKKNRLDILEVVGEYEMSRGETRGFNNWFYRFSDYYYYSDCPSGWIDLDVCELVDFKLKLVRILDPAAHRILIDQATQLAKDVDSTQKARWYSSITAICEFPLLNHYSWTAQSQVSLDQYRIACGLERYRLAHGKYPESLADLFGELPKSPISGRAYRYQVLPDQTFQLSSPSWNVSSIGPEPEWTITNKL